MEWEKYPLETLKKRLLSKWGHSDKEIFINYDIQDIRGLQEGIKKEQFDINISGKLEGIGAELREENGYIKVVRIVAGSASFLQGDLQPEDLILKVGQGDEEPVDTVGMKVSKIVQLIRGKKGTEVRLTVRHVDVKKRSYLLFEILLK